ncbi:unnamed protein product [Polarella glacialis]|uniref:Cytochrome b5 heme-binding domain-containing protein n=1 Tax=Polarella glacialis TaxID=89957 RepID=A0A813J1R0_POLGL|nr:unnamed protein product [Polarella glacialis]
MAAQKVNPASFPISTITDVNMLYRYLEEVLVPSLYENNTDTQMALEQSAALHPIDASNRMLGTVRLRQARVSIQEDCQVTPLFSQYKVACYPGFTESTQSMDPYGPELRFKYSDDSLGGAYTGQFNTCPDLQGPWDKPDREALRTSGMADAVKTMSMDEVAKHNTKEDCWVVLYGKAYDLSKFARVHPGGAKLITDAAGMDATALFDPIHPKDIMEKLLKPEVLKCVVEPGSIKPAQVAKVPEKKKAAPKKKVASQGAEEEEWVFKKPPLAAMLNSFDFESVAREVMEPQAWGYYSSGGDDEITLRDNHLAFQRITMRPRILVNVKEIDLRTTMLGIPCSLPLYFTATALAKLAHQDGHEGAEAEGSAVAQAGHQLALGDVVLDALSEEDARLLRTMVGAAQWLALSRPDIHDSAQAYADANFAGEVGIESSREYTSGGVIALQGVVLTTYGRTQSLVARSAAEVELLALDSGLAEALFVQSSMMDMDRDADLIPVQAWTDSTACLRIAQRLRVGKLRHLANQEVRRTRQVELAKTDCEPKVADNLIKHLQPAKLEHAAPEVVEHFHWSAADSSKAGDKFANLQVDFVRYATATTAVIVQLTCRVDFVHATANTTVIETVQKTHARHAQ